MAAWFIELLHPSAGRVGGPGRAPDVDRSNDRPLVGVTGVDH